MAYVLTKSRDRSAGSWHSIDRTPAGWSFGEEDLAAIYIDERGAPSGEGDQP
jgi:hypothetical protein